VESLMSFALPEPALIAPRRYFLRALGLTVAGTTLPIPLLLADTPEHRIALQLEQLSQALQSLYPETTLIASWRQRDPREAGFSPLRPGDPVAMIRAAVR
jgi:hypothetical protein